MYLYALNFHLF